ncbi:G3E family GTPase [Pseudarthrobacter sp. W1I19]|uniref:GTP-binding protein n=1 Tax=Pseudarthrobacter sp. W1I19 TaxID=3042288 RepID=UPI002780EE08|nr:GTP-binding protein [Pseudarthrobacter sp. W1I19]MDQ0921619.1 G3E family GTPase [Pseudarthrobacter sp. W1I19]
MTLLVVSSLDALCRQQACEDLAAARPGSLVVLHDLLESGLVIRRVFSGRILLEREETTLEHGCLSCAVRLDLVPSIERLLKKAAGPIIIGLPPGVPSSAAVSALRRTLSRPASVGSVVLACSPDALEDNIWEAHTLFESGFTPLPEEERTPGEFLLGELAFADTVLLTEPDIVPPDPLGRERGLHLIPELAPHIEVAHDAAAVRAGLHRYRDAVARTAPGNAFMPTRSSGTPGSPFATMFQRVERPLHPGRFRQVLATLAEGCCVLRGQLWMASAPACRIAIQGIGPRVWLENLGPWPEGAPAGGVKRTAQEPAATVIAATGEGLDADEFEQLLVSCQLTDEELAAGGNGMHDPFGLFPLEESTPPKGTAS